MITKEQTQQFAAGCLLGLGIFGLLTCAFIRGCQELSKNSKSNDKMAQVVKPALNQSR